MSKNNFRPEYQAKLPRTEHDLSQRVVFSSSVGQFLPVFHHLLNPSEHVYMNMSIFSRSQPLLTAAMADIEEDVDVFFVPFPMLYTGFEASAYQTNDYLSSFFSEDTPSDMPVWTPNEVQPHGQQNITSALLGSNDIGGVNGLLSAFRLFNHLRYNPFSVSLDIPSDSDPDQWWRPLQGDSEDDGYVQGMMFPYALLAYHAIYYKFFCLQDYEIQRVSYYNWDKYVNRRLYGENLPVQFYHLHYVPYMRPDYFNSTLPSPMISSANMVTDEHGGSWSEEQLDKVHAAMRLFVGNSDNLHATSVSPVDGETFSIDSFAQVSPDGINYEQVNTNQLRAAFALEKYLRVLGRTDKTYDAQVLAHLGFKVPHDTRHQITHIGHFHSEINIGEVVSTAQTTSADTETGASLGEIAGKGFGGNKANKVVDFTAPCHGVVMAVYYCKPARIYNGEHFDKINLFRGIEDLWNPEFDALGVQPLFRFEVNNSYSESDNNTIVGWQHRFQERKQKFDWASYAFTPNNDDDTGEETPRFNNWRAWLNVMNPLRFRSFFRNTLTSHLVLPDDLDNLFAVQFVKSYNMESLQRAPWLMFQGDPFLHDLRINCNLVSPMSKTGEPRLDF